MGSAASKGARRLPKTAPTAHHASPGVPRPPPETFAPPPQSAPSAPPPSSDASGAADAPASQFEYGIGRERTARSAHPADAPFSGEKDENVIKDAMDPQFLANLQKMGQVAVDPGNQMRAPSRAQRTLTARKKEYTSPTATPPPGTTTMAAMTELLDTLKALPPGTDPESWYRQLGLKSEDMAAVRRWVNSPSVGDDETLHIKDGGNQMVEQTLEMKAIWVEAKDKGARKL